MCILYMYIHIIQFQFQSSFLKVVPRSQEQLETKLTKKRTLGNIPEVTWRGQVLLHNTDSGKGSRKKKKKQLLQHLLTLPLMHQVFPLYSTITAASDRLRSMGNAAKPTATISIIAVEKASMALLLFVAV